MLAALATAPVHAETHTFTDTSGQTFTAQIIAVKKGEVIIRRDNGKVYSLDLTTLSAADRQFIATWKMPSVAAPATPATTDSSIEIKISVEAAKPGDNTQLAARISLINQEDCAEFKGLKGTLIIVGQQADGTAKYKVLAVEKFNGDLPGCDKLNFTSRAFDPAQATNPNQPSYPYKGYLFVLQNSEGNIIQFLRSGPFAQDGTAALQLSVGAIFNGPEHAAHRMRLVTYPDARRTRFVKKPSPLRAKP